MRITKALVLVWMLLCSAVASASVVYKWETLSTSDTIHFASGEIEITDEAWASGGVSYTLPGCVLGDPSCLEDPASPVLRFRFSAYAPIGGANFDIRPTLFASWTADPRGPFSVDLEFSSVMKGSIFASDLSTMLSMDGGEIWTIRAAASDGGSCSNTPGLSGVCTGATGRWVLTEVPEPATFALLGLGLLGFAARRRLV